MTSRIYIDANNENLREYRILRKERIIQEFLYKWIIKRGRERERERESEGTRQREIAKVLASSNRKLE